MRALLLGADGKVGRSLCSTVPQDVELLALGRAKCDITDPDQVFRAISEAGPTIVINAAAYTAVDRAEADQEQAQRLNTTAPGYVAQAAHAAGARVLHLSTDFVFSGTTSTPYSPNDLPDPLSVYGRTKLGGEQAVRDVDPNALIVRTAWVYSNFAKNFVTSMLNLMAEGGPIRVVCDQIGTPTYSEALAEALWVFVLKGSSGTLHYTDAGVASWYDFAVAIYEEATDLHLIRKNVEIFPISTADYPTVARRPSYSVLDKRDTWEILGRPAPHWRANLRKMLKERKVNA
jgi:dTDP-4-dehydrorhamnose reductase